MPASTTITFIVEAPVEEVVAIKHDPLNPPYYVGDSWATPLVAIGDLGNPVEVDYEIVVDDPSVVVASITDSVLEVQMIGVGVGAVTVTGKLRGGAPPSEAAPWYAFDPTDYATLQAIWDDADIANSSSTNSKTLETGLTTPWGGTKAIKTQVDSGEGTGGIIITYPNAASDQPREIWMEWYVKFSSNWKTDWAGEGNPDHKTWLTFPQTTTPYTRWSWKMGTFGTDHSIYVADDGSTPNCDNAYSSLTPNLPNDVWNGAWHRVRQKLKLHSTPVAEESVCDGEIHAWFGEDLLVADTSVGNNHGLDSYYWNKTHLSDIINQPPTETMYLWVGRFRAWTSDPGW